ncbi:MAG: redoxin domain-containing protein [Sphingobacteriaceae bacterium]
MKRIILTVLAISPLLLFAQADSYLVKGKAGTLNAPAKAYLVYSLQGGEKIDSAAVMNGAFEFKNVLEEPTRAALILDHQGIGLTKLEQGSADFLSFFLEKGTIVINSADSISKANISGSPLNEENKELQASLETIGEKMRSLMTEAAGISSTDQQSPDFKNKFDAKQKSIQTEQKGILKKFIQAHPQSLVSLDAIKIYAGPYPDLSELDPLYAGLSEKLKKSDSGRAFAAALNQLKINAVGTLAPDFTQNDPNGKPVKLSSFKGKYVLIDFWASWCAPCREENPNVVKVFNQYKDKNFTVLGVSLDKEKTNWVKAIENDGLTWTHVSDLKGWYNEVATLYSVRAVPQNLLIDPTGKIIAKNLRGEELVQRMAELIK